MSAESASDVSGPVATITGDQSLSSRGSARTSSRATRDAAGARLMASVTLLREHARDRRRAPRRPGRATRSAARMHERAEPPHLFFQQADGVVELVAAEGVAADQFGEPVGLVHRGRHARGRISCSVTGTPSSAACHAASLPASPPPMTWIISASNVTSTGSRPLVFLRAAAAPASWRRAARGRLAAAGASGEQADRFLDRQRFRRLALRQRGVGRAVGDVRTVAAVEHAHAARRIRDARRARAVPSAAARCRRDRLLLLREQFLRALERDGVDVVFRRRAIGTRSPASRTDRIARCWR